MGWVYQCVYTFGKPVLEQARLRLFYFRFVHERAAELLRRGAVDRHVPVRPDMRRIPPVLFEVTPDRRRI